jgi:hypothetical protein
MVDLGDPKDKLETPRRKEWPRVPDAPVALFDRDGEVYADCEPLDLMAQGATDAEALENLAYFVRAYYAMRALGCKRPGENPRNRLLRIAFADKFNRFTFMPVPVLTPEDAVQVLREMGSNVEALLAHVEEDRRRELLR